VLTRQGVTGWRRALTRLTPDSASRPAFAVMTSAAAAAVPVPIAAELVDALAAVALAGAGPAVGFSAFP
jgi:hypothetical protein